MREPGRGQGAGADGHLGILDCSVGRSPGVSGLSEVAGPQEDRRPSSAEPRAPRATADTQVPEGDHFQAGHFPAYGDLGRESTCLQTLLVR